MSRRGKHRLLGDQAMALMENPVMLRLFQEYEADLTRQMDVIDIADRDREHELVLHGRVLRGIRRKLVEFAKRADVEQANREHAENSDIL